MGSTSEQISPNELRVNDYANPDYDLNVPDEAPPSYEEVMASNNTTHSGLQNRIRNSTRRERRLRRAEQLDPILLLPSSVAYNEPNGLLRRAGPQPVVGSPGVSETGASSIPMSLPVNPNTPWNYPPMYHCFKCLNTGIKLKNGLSCKDCWQLFGPRSSHIQPLRYLPEGVVYSSNLTAGDPALGGVLCGACRGAGNIDFLLFNAQCPVCRGVGRVLIA